MPDSLYIHLRRSFYKSSQLFGRNAVGYESGPMRLWAAIEAEGRDDDDTLGSSLLLFFVRRVFIIHHIIFFYLLFYYYVVLLLKFIRVV